MIALFILVVLITLVDLFFLVLNEWVTAEQIKWCDDFYDYNLKIIRNANAIEDIDNLASYNVLESHITMLWKVWRWDIRGFAKDQESYNRVRPK